VDAPNWLQYWVMSDSDHVGWLVVSELRIGRCGESEGFRGLEVLAFVVV
jgi:hypothetical protein